MNAPNVVTTSSRALLALPGSAAPSTTRSYLRRRLRRGGAARTPAKCSPSATSCITILKEDGRGPSRLVKPVAVTYSCRKFLLYPHCATIWASRRRLFPAAPTCIPWPARASNTADTTSDRTRHGVEPEPVCFAIELRSFRRLCCCAARARARDGLVVDGIRRRSHGAGSSPLSAG